MYNDWEMYGIHNNMLYGFQKTTGWRRLRTDVTTGGFGSGYPHVLRDFDDIEIVWKRPWEAPKVGSYVTLEDLENLPDGSIVIASNVSFTKFKEWYPNSPLRSTCVDKTIIANDSPVLLWLGKDDKLDTGPDW